MIYALIVLLAIPAVFVVVGVVISAPGYEGPPSDHFDGKRFHNPDGIRAKGFKDVIRWMFTRKRSLWNKVDTPTIRTRPLAFFDQGVRITFVNHSTFLIQTEGVNILTDPVWSRRVSPFGWIGPQRLTAPGVALEDLPRIHAVLLTHNHYDHLDLQTLRTIFGAHHPDFVVPLGVKRFLERNWISNVHELDWDSEIQIKEKLQITSVPAIHFSGRGLVDRDRTLWCGYVVRAGRHALYFAGDTGYHPNIFKQIGQKFKPDISIIPVGAYKPEWFMSPIHVSPDEAVTIFKETGSAKGIAMHFGTFQLADESRAETAEDFAAALQKHEVDPGAFVMPGEGEVIIVD